ncbi:MAG TPA: prolyl oligopeptidase family serine peptidase [Acidimicrobiales bacterium]|nr:prolyl oligopeptidase family serine peptidase [Acidimicrobiales bacterium]
MPDVAPYGSWRSPVTLDLLVEQVVRLSYPAESAGHAYWVEGRPAEGGRQVIVRAPRGGDGTPEDLFGPEHYARTLVHEYGGLAYAVAGATVFFSNFADQRLYRIDPGGPPRAVTAEVAPARSVRYAAPAVTPDGRFVLAVRERHPEPDLPAEVVNDVVILHSDGSDEPRVVAAGHDFYSHVVVSPAGDRVAWISWDHPNMPWDSTELWEADLAPDGAVSAVRKVAGGPGESVTEPKYGPDGVLHFVSDRTGWWNLYRVGAGGRHEALAPMEADLGVPDWAFGASQYAVLAGGTVVASWHEEGTGRLGVLEGTPPAAGGAFREIRTSFTDFGQLRSSDDGRHVLAVAGSPTEAPSIVRIDSASGAIEVLRRSRAATIDAAYLSVPEPIDFPTEHGLEAHALFYPPHNPDFVAPAGELPPLIVRSHGGPTSATTSVLDYGIQFWTSRGIGVVDVNYGGSTGYGRAYRERLRGNWGIVDLDDCVNAARYLAASGRADPARLLIHGGSAGGYTTLCAVTFRDVFAAGASYFGVADAGALARDTHKFESRYLDSMIGPWPEAEEVYRERSPIFHTDRLRTPLILFQGLEDKVVPPAQAEAMAAALAEKQVPHAYIAYEGEQHGFRKAENVKRTAEAELYFYGRVLGFTPADDLEPVRIELEERLGT